jgi:DNA-binding GntR family transcriptional regulator
MAQRSFLYVDVAAEIRSRISQGVWAPGSRLPSLSEFVAQFNVSAITIRRALGELMHEGLIEGHQGLGVFVKPIPKIHRVLAGDFNSTIGDEIARAGFRPRLEEIGFGQLKASEEVASRMKLPAGSNVYRHQKVTYADDEPVALHTLYMRPKMAQSLRNELSQQFIFRLLEDRKLDVANLKCEFSAVPLNDEQARILQLQPGLPMLRIDYTHIDKLDAPEMFGQTICRADRFVFEVTLPRKPERAAKKSSQTTQPGRSRHRPAASPH